MGLVIIDQSAGLIIYGSSELLDIQDFLSSVSLLCGAGIIFIVVIGGLLGWHIFRSNTNTTALSPEEP
jgi:hypothetical protein